MELFAIAITLLTGVLTYLAWRNGRWMKQSHEETKELIKSTHEETKELIKTTHDETKALIKSMQEETLKVFERIALLIHEEEEKTRKLLKSES